MAAIQAAGSIAPAGPEAIPGGMPGNIPGGIPGFCAPPAAKALIHLPIISMNSGSAAVAAIWSRQRSWNRFARSSRSAAAFLLEFFPSLMGGEYNGAATGAPANNATLFRAAT